MKLSDGTKVSFGAWWWIKRQQFNWFILSGKWPRDKELTR